MNLRTLKKLSKKAAPLLAALGDDREQFRSERWENYHHAFIGSRKHWERSRCYAAFEGRNDWGSPRGADIVFLTRAGFHIVMRPPSHPRKGTVMVGAMCGHYQPEWEEECAWIALDSLVRGHFTDYDLLENEDYEGGCLTRDLSTPALILLAARELAAKGGSA